MAKRIGVMTSFVPDGDSFAHVAEFGLDVCQLVSWDQRAWERADAPKVREQAEQAGVEVVCCWVGYPLPVRWNWTLGPDTAGLVPPEYRAIRLGALMVGADFAAEMGVQAIATHVGFIPQECTSDRYAGVLAAIYEIASYCHDLGLEFWFETGQEMPVTLLRTIEDLRLPNLGINLDPANLILYGTGNPVDSLDVFGKYVRCVHAKDGVYTTNGQSLGKEVKVGDGKVNFPVLVKGLDEVGFEGDYIIEREISGEQQKKDIAETVTYLNGLL